jgi:hypothetical protein
MKLISYNQGSQNFILSSQRYKQRGVYETTFSVQEVLTDRYSAQSNFNTSQVFHNSALLYEEDTEQFIPFINH